MIFKQLFKIKQITPFYIPLKVIQLLSETFFSNIKNKKLFGGIKMRHPIYIEYVKKSLCKKNHTILFKKWQLY